MPVPRRSVVVWAPTQVSHVSGSGKGDCSGPGMRPSRLYGYSDS